MQLQNFRRNGKVCADYLSRPASKACVKFMPFRGFGPFSSTAKCVVHPKPQSVVTRTSDHVRTETFLNFTLIYSVIP